MSSQTCIPVIALTCGLLIAGGVHTVKSAVIRPAVTATTGGVGNTPVSLLEDITATVVSFISILIPILIVFIVILFVVLIVMWRQRREHCAKTCLNKGVNYVHHSHLQIKTSFPLNRPQKNSNPIWVVLIILIVLFCCCCLCLGLLATWMFRITIQFLSNLFGWVNPMLAHLSVILMAA